MTWESEIEELLLTGMKYCFSPRASESSDQMLYPTVVKSEFYGTPSKGIVGMPGHESGEPGFLDAVTSTLRNWMKKEFYEGYYQGSCDAVADTKGEMTIDRDLNKHGASKRWEERQKK